ncbi:MAG: DUF4445 domain-containing protein [Alphaproteobacteria bacterium]|nr:DUF4445 domain-containing protein [Alphaproteobacteria bacterium]
MNLKIQNGEDRIIRLCPVTVAEPDIHDPSSDARRLVTALESATGLNGIAVDLGVLKILQKTLRQGQWRVTAASNGACVVAVYAGEKTDIYGVAFDIGAGMIEAVLCNLNDGKDVARTRMINPLVRFGADPVNRIASGMNKPADIPVMRDALRHALDHLCEELASHANIERNEIADAVFVADPVCHHLLLDLDPVDLGRAPFTEAISEPLEVKASELGINVAPDAFVYALPLIAHHVGSDLSAAAFHCAITEKDAPTLLIDIGTTTEILLAANDQILAASPPAGATLEGTGIEAGRHIVDGAIDRFQIDAQTFEPRFHVIGVEAWSNDAAFATQSDAVQLGGLCRAGLIDALAELRLSGLLGRDGALKSEMASSTKRLREEYRSYSYLIREFEPRIAMTQHDIRALQMAKAAVQAAARILMKQLGVTDLARVILTSGTGPAIDPLRAGVIGLFPDCDAAHLSFVENAAFEGAKAALISRSARAAIAGLAKRIKVVETVLDPDFSMEQIGATGLPHARLAFTKISAALEIPDNEDRAAERRGGRRARS